MSNGKGLNNEGALEALRVIAKRWLDHDGAKAYVIVQQASKHAALEEMEDIPPGLAHRALDVLRSSGSCDVVRWTEEAIAEVRRAESEGVAQVLDPVTLAIAGAAIIGTILAARVRKVGAVEFYQGVPKELADVLRAGEAILREPLDLGGGAAGGGG